MPNETRFHIEVQQRCLLVSLHGEWNLSADMRYLTELTRSIAQIQSRPWGLVVNMLDWTLASSDDLASISKDVANVQLDRRNQVFECWVVKNDKQAIELQKFVESVKHVEFKRVTSIQAAQQWISTFKL